MIVVEVPVTNQDQASVAACSQSVCANVFELREPWCTRGLWNDEGVSYQEEYDNKVGYSFCASIPLFWRVLSFQNHRTCFRRQPALCRCS